MNEAIITTAKPGRRWVRITVRVVAVVLLAALAFGGWMVWNGISISLRAEANLHATLFAMGLVDQFVAEKDRWPHSWEELEGMSNSGDPQNPETGARKAIRIGGQRSYKWPAASPEIQKHVTIDFSANMAVIAQEDPMAFTSIKPIGPYYEYRDYGHVESLQHTIRDAMSKSRRQPH